MAVGLFVGVWVARYLGPGEFGQLNYAMAFVGLFAVIAGLGLNGIIVRDIVQDPQTANTTLGTAFVMQAIVSLLAVVLIVGIMAWLRPDDVLTRAIVAVLGLGLVFKSTEVVKFWFESQVQSRYTVWVENGVFLVLAAVKIAMILLRLPLMAFVWATLFESVLIAIGLLLVYGWRGGHLTDWQPRIERAKSLLKESWPLLLSGLAIFLFMRVDQLMIGMMAGDRDVGIYAAAIRLSEPWYFLSGIVASSVFPLIARYRIEDAGHYDRKLGLMLRIVVGLHLVVSLVFTIGAGFIVNLLFSTQYHESAAILAIHVWTGVFQAMGVISGQWMVYEGLLKEALIRNACGAILSLTMNVLLIPQFGGVGAAVSALVSVIVAYYLMDLFFPLTRGMFWLKTRAMWLGGWSDSVR